MGRSRLLQRREKGTAGGSLPSALDGLAGLGVDIVLVPGDRQLWLQDATDALSSLPASENAHGR